MKIYYKVKNGDSFSLMWKDQCAVCGKEILCCDPHEEERGEVYCGDCAFIEGLITEKTFIKVHRMWAPTTRAAVKDGKIYECFVNEKFPWEKTKQDERLTPEYKEWRTKVFMRDKFTCVICGKTGGELEAHHIYTFADHPDLRLDIKNGVTLCKTCHKKVHKEKIGEWLHID